MATVSSKKADGADAIVEQIKREENAAALDVQFDAESSPQAPTLIIGEKKHNWLVRLLKSRKFWVSCIGLLIVATVMAWLVTPSRLWALNTLGLRAQLLIGTTVATSGEGVPPILKNAKVTINGQDYHTDDHGNLKVTMLYGSAHIEISKQGYESQTRDIMLDFDPFFYYLGGKQQDEQVRNIAASLKSVGIPVQFTAKDWLTGDPVTFGQFSVGDVAAEPNTNGVVSLILPATDAPTLPMSVKFGRTYADTTIDLLLAKEPQTFTFVPAGKHYFISKRTGQYAVYSANLDGTAVAEIVPGAASETGDIAFSVSPSGRYGVLASAREASRDSFGSLQQKLYVVDLTSNKLTAVDQGLRFNLVDWSGETLVYSVSSNVAGGVVQRLGGVDAQTAKQTMLAQEPVIATARVSLANVVFLTGSKELKTAKIKGGTVKSLGAGVVQFTQTDIDRFAYQTSDTIWHQYNVNADQVANVATPGSTGRVFLASSSADKQTQLVVDTIDGTLTLLAKKVAGGQETKLYTGADLRGPITWVGNVVVYRAGSADYVVSPNGGAAKKITDVTTSPNSTNAYFELN